MTRIIGVELRVYTSFGCRQEMTVIPVDIELPDFGIGVVLDFDATLHTSNAGDYTFGHGAYPNPMRTQPDVFRTADRRAGA